MIREVVEAWKAWADKPGNEERAAACEDACQALARSVGTDGTRLRIAVLARLQAGQELRSAVEGAVRLFEREKAA